MGQSLELAVVAPTGPQAVSEDLGALGFGELKRWDEGRWDIPK